MPRRYYTRYRPRAYVKRRKWSPTLGQGVMNTQANANATGFSSTVLCANSINQGTDAPVSTIIKVKNFKCVIDIFSNGPASSTRNVFFAIMFVPQGFTISATTPTEHPEWIMVWRTVDIGVTTDSNIPSASNLQLSSRLTRNLNSGDKIVLYHSFYNNTTSTNVISSTFYCSFVTCNN